jgi:hypothetical protein
MKLVDKTQRAAHRFLKNAAVRIFVRAAAVVTAMIQMAAQLEGGVSSWVCAPICAYYDPAPLGMLRPVAVGSAKQRAGHWQTQRGLCAALSRLVLTATS